MTIQSKTVAVFLESGQKRVFAGALAWPGWYGHGRDEQIALQSLLAYGPRYAKAIGDTQLDFSPPSELAGLTVVERLPGNATTDFGAPDIPPAADGEPMDEQALHQMQALLTACWETLATTYQAALGKELRKGPRGGGRELPSIIDHVVDAHYSYLRRITWKATRASAEPLAALEEIKQATNNALAMVQSQGLPTHGPRGGAIWRPRTFVRRAAWHILDHIWEIEDRVLP